MFLFFILYHRKLLRIRQTFQHLQYPALPIKITDIFPVSYTHLISYKVFAVSDTKEIKTNSGISLTTDDVIANLKGHEDEFDAFEMCIRDRCQTDFPYSVPDVSRVPSTGLL